MLNSYAWMNNLLVALAETGDAAATDGAAATEGAATTASSSGSMISTVIMLVAMVAIFYFLLIRPQRKKDKKVKDMLSALKVGDRICTIGGIYGTVTKLKEDTITLVVGAQKSEMVMARWAVRSVEDAPTENDAEPQV